MRNGTGTFLQPENLSKDKYQGKWLDDLKHGQGRMKYANGDTVVGTWHFDRLNGVAKIKGPNDWFARQVLY